MNMKKAEVIINSVRKRIDECLEHAPDMFSDYDPNIDITLNLMDNLEIKEDIDTFDCIIPIQLEIKKGDEETISKPNAVLCVLIDGCFEAVVPTPIAINTDEAIHNWVMTEFKSLYKVTYFFIEPDFGMKFLKVKFPGGSDSIRHASMEYAYDLCMEWRIAKSSETYKG